MMTLLLLTHSFTNVDAFLAPSKVSSKLTLATSQRPFVSQPNYLSQNAENNNPFSNIFGIFNKDGGDTKMKPAPKSRVAVAKELMTELIVEEKCFTTESGARKLADCLAPDVLYEDCFEPQPIVGKFNVTDHLLKKVAMRKNDKGEFGLRLDQISDGSTACGFAWTYTTGSEEGLRGTTFVELNGQGEISYVREIPEPLFKPGNLTAQLLEAITKGAKPKPPVEFEKKTPTSASEIAKYLFQEVQGSDIDEGMRFFDESIIYRDFNFEEPLYGKDDVRKFIQDFSFPGITFRQQKIDDGIECTCFTWEVVLELPGPDGPEESPDTIKGISLYKLNPETNLISYVRDVPESAIKPPILGKLARDLRPGLGVFQGVKLGSREGGL